MSETSNDRAHLTQDTFWRKKLVRSVRWALLVLSILIIPDAFAVPGNDNFANRFTLTGSSGSTTSNNYDATAEAGEPSHMGFPAAHSVWWKWVAPASGPVTFDLHGTSVVGSGTCSFRPLIEVYTGTQLTALTSVAAGGAYGWNVVECNNTYYLVDFAPSASFNAVAGQEYEIAVDAASFSANNLQITSVLNWTQTVPTNDNFVNSISISGASGQTAGTVINASAEPGEPNTGGGSATAKTTWWSWTPLGPGVVKLGMISWNTYVGLFPYTGTAVNSLQPVPYYGACANQGEVGAYSSSFVIPLCAQVQGGAPLQIQAAVNNLDAGSFTYSWRFVAAPPNDLFHNAQTITGSEGQVSGTTRGAGMEVGEPTGGAATLASIWYTWTAPMSSSFTFKLDGPNPQNLINQPYPHLDVYTGNNVNALSHVAGVTGWGSTLQFDATSGTNYQIAVSHSGFEVDCCDVTVSWSNVGNDVPLPPWTMPVLGAAILISTLYVLRRRSLRT